MVEKINGFKDTIEWYEENAKKYSSNIEGLPSINLINKFIKLLEGKYKILDAGCAAGRDCRIFKDLGLDPLGIDLSESLLKIAKEKNTDLEFKNGNFMDLPFEKESFDGVWAHASLLHLEKNKDVLKSLKEFNRILTKKGIIHVFLKQQQTDEKSSVVSDKLSGHDRFFQWFKKDEVKSLLEKSGFKIIELTDNNEDPAGRKEVKWIIAFAKK